MNGLVYLLFALTKISPLSNNYLHRGICTITKTYINLFGQNACHILSTVAGWFVRGKSKVPSLKVFSLNHIHVRNSQADLNYYICW